ncbi:MAG: ABC transporter [Thermogutta sp.]|nr:MAG: ABC transporter [Thermogutta sp.]
MHLFPVRQIYRHGTRWAEILSVLSKYGLADWIDRLGLEIARDLIKGPTGEIVARLPWTTRFRLALTELGPTFIKLGQVLSTRPDVVGVELARELEELQEHVTPDPPEVVRRVIRSELGHDPEELFAEFHEEPLASASIGQVHAARLKDGRHVVLKIQHPGIEEKILVDLEILGALAMLAEKLPDLQAYRPVGLMTELKRTMTRELDFQRELRNLQEFEANFRDSDDLKIPRAFPEFSTKRVLAMEYLEGIKLADHAQIERDGIDCQAVALRGARAYLKMIFQDGFYHADPHPGNILILRDGRVGLLDFGMVGRLDEELREDVQVLLSALASQDAITLADVISHIGRAPRDLDRASLTVDLTDYVSYYGHLPIDQFDLGGALNEMFEILRRYRIMLPARIALVLKTLVILEGTAQLLNPKFHLLYVIQEYQQQFFWQQFSLRRRLRKLRRATWRFQHLIDALPQNLLDLFDHIRSGQFDIRLEHRGLEPSANRLVSGLLASALFVGCSLMLAFQVPPLLGDLPWIGSLFNGHMQNLSFPGALGAGISVVWGWRLWRAIRKSGLFDRS